MHSCKTILLILILLGSCKTKSGLPRNYDFTPVLIHLDANKQADSLGFNLAEAIPELLYPRILTGDLALWENADKSAIKGPKKLRALEKIATQPFVRSNNLFIHQYWQIFKRNFEFGIQGFSFSGESQSGTVINYGYVDAPDLIALLKSEFVPTDANGSSDITYWDALHTMMYDFSLIQFGNNNFKQDARISAELQYQAIHDPQVYRKFTRIPERKKISYKVLNPEISTNPENSVVFDKLQQYVNNNKQTILNASNSDYFKEHMSEPWPINGITVVEEWEKISSLPLQKFESITLFIEKEGITLTSSQLDEMGIQINLQGFVEYLSEKRFSYLVEQVNEEEILPNNSEKTYQSLLKNDWNKIN